MKRGLLIGIAIGALCGWFFTRNYYENEYEVIDNEAEAELETMKEEGVELLDKDETPRVYINKDMDRKRPRVNVVENVRELSPIDPKRADIELITEDDYDEEYENYDKVELQYKVEEDALYDSSGDHEESFECVGKGHISDLRDGNSPFMYIRNHKLEIDYLVERCSIHDNIPEYHSLAAAYDEEKTKILDAKNGGNING